MNDTTILLGGGEINEVTLARLEEIYRRLNHGIRFGSPIEFTGTGVELSQRINNVYGTFCELVLTAAAGTITATHNLNIPITTVTGSTSTANRLNVRWIPFGYEFGSRSGDVAQPAAPGAFSAEFLHMLSQSLTANEITLHYSVTGFLPTATTPLYATLFFIPATR